MPDEQLPVNPAAQLDALRSSLGNSSKRDQILKGALSAFLEFGYDGTSIDRIATQAKVSKPTIYTHFKDKEALFAALIDLICSHLVVPARNASQVELEPSVYLHKYASTYLKRMDEWEYVSFLRLIVGESGRLQEIAHLYTSKIIQPAVEQLTQYMARNMRLADPEATARIFLGALHSHVILHEMLGAKYVLEMARDRYIRSLVDMVLALNKREA